MGWEIVHDDDVPGLQCRCKELLDIGQEGVAVDGTIENHGCNDAIDPQGADKCCGLPVPVRDPDFQPFALGNAPASPGHGR